MIQPQPGFLQFFSRSVSICTYAIVLCINFRDFLLDRRLLGVEFLPVVLDLILLPHLLSYFELQLDYLFCERPKLLFE
jgi:hypothetical protein